MRKMDEITRDLDDLLEKHGIQTYAFLFRDPDTSDTITKYDGDIVWKVGALKCMLQDQLDFWADADAGSITDDGEEWKSGKEN